MRRLFDIQFNHRAFSRQRESSFFMRQHGFTFPELLISLLVFSTAIVGILYAYTRFMALDELSENAALALQGAQAEVEQLKEVNFTDLSLYDDQTFAVGGLNGIGVIDVVSVQSDLSEIWVTYSWRQNSNLLVGEDADLDGTLDGGEDANSNGRLDSPVQLMTYRFRR